MPEINSKMENNLKANPNDQLLNTAEKLKKNLSGQVRIDHTARLLYSTDASIYQIEPMGVVFPKDIDDLQAIVQVCAEYNAPVIARGSGSSLAGQAIGAGWIIDCSRFLNRLIEINPEEHTALVEPGLILNSLNKQASEFGLMFGPDPASAERASMGGCISNNAAGAHSICYGMTADHVIGLDVVLSDGAAVELKEISTSAAVQIAADNIGREADLYRAALQIRETKSNAIKENWPRTWRRASGYNLNYLIPWSPAQPRVWSENNPETLPYPPVQSGSINLASLISGAEGTLGVIRKAQVRLVPKPTFSILTVLAFSDIAQACDQVPAILGTFPSAVELIPQNLIALARSVPAYAEQVSVLSPLMESQAGVPALLVVEYTGGVEQQIREKASTLAKNRKALVADSAASQKMIWGVRKAGLGLFMSRPGDQKPWSFIEDLSVPVDRLGEFVREMERIMASYGVEGENYGHASAGCLHIRPVINLKSVQGVQTLRSLASDAVNLTLSLGGAVSGEHGDGISRSEWNERMFGAEITSMFREIKQAADPDGLMNPGRIVSLEESLPLPTMNQNLRFGADYQSKGWKTVFSFSKQAGLTGAVEQCNGAGVCRKADGVMCPSFQASREEVYSTRGRANLLRAMVSASSQTEPVVETAIFQALDFCLACKGCKAECPSSVDMAKLKYEFLEWYYLRHRRRLRDFLFGYIGQIAQFVQPLHRIANPIMMWSLTRIIGERLLGISRKRGLPRFAARSLHSQWKRFKDAQDIDKERPDQSGTHETVLFLSDPFTEYFEPEVGVAALKALRSSGYDVVLLPVIGTGRTLISKGFLQQAKRHAINLVRSIEALDPKAIYPIVGVEPSEVLWLMDEYPDLLPEDPIVQSIADRSFCIEELLLRVVNERKPDAGKGSLSNAMRIAIPDQLGNPFSSSSKIKVLVHSHCYQKARSLRADGSTVGAGAAEALLRSAGYEVEMIDSGCCGMAGAFGYEEEHYGLSMDIGELSLFPAVRTADESTLIAASGTSCRSQIKDGVGRKAFHPVELFSKLE